MKQILIVEDDSFLNKMLDYNLTADGYGVTSTLNARTAADAIRQREFDLVLLDINLPDGNGFELCKLIKPQHPDTIVIFLTANDQESDQIRGYEVDLGGKHLKPDAPAQRRRGAIFRQRFHKHQQRTDGIVAGEQRQKDLAHPGTESCAEHCTCLFQTGGNVQHGVFEHGEHERKNVQAHHQHQTAQCEEDLFASGGCWDQLLQKPLFLHK